MQGHLIIVLVCLISLTGCAKRSIDIIGVQGKDFGTVGIDQKACEIPNGYIYMSPEVLDTYVGAKIDE